jgi:hypothetical protein
MLCGATTGGYKAEPKFYWVCKGVGVAHITVCILREQNLGEGRGNTFTVFLKEGRQGDCSDAQNPGEDPATPEETIPKGQAGEEFQILSSL